MFWKKTPPPPAPIAIPVAAAAPEPRPERRFTDRLSHPETFIAPGMRLIGDMHGSDSVEIGGSVEGHVSTGGLCRVREGASLRGKLRAGFAVLEGRVEGQIDVRRKVELRGAAHVKADIQAEGVAIAEGCFFDGRVHMVGGGGAEEEASRSFQEKRRT